MFTKGITTYISNPVVGLLPFILYVILHATMDEKQYALGISLSVSILADIFLYRLFKSRIYSLIFYISTASLALTLLFWIFAHSYVIRPNTYLVLCEFWIVIFFMILRMSKMFVVTKFYRKKDYFQKTLINSFFHTTMLIQYLLTLHLLLMLVDRQLRFGMTSYKIPDSIIFLILPILIIFSLGLLQVIKIKTFISKLRAEEWLPIVTDKGEVTGKIAKSVSFKMKNKFLHPVVRVALISNGKIYLQERKANDTLDPGKLDCPFEKHMLFSHDINLSARNSILQTLGNDMDLCINFTLKYIYENDETRRLIFLFAAKIDDENMIKRGGNMHGKFWTMNQIEEAFVDEIFSECFELEFEYLKNMVVLPSNKHLKHSI